MSRATRFPKMRMPLFAFFLANLISYVGDRLTLLAIPWFVLQTTGSVAKTGVTAFFTTLPNIISAFFSGLLVDCLGYKRTSVLGDIASGISTLLIPLLYHTVGLAFWQLLVLAFLGGLLKAPGETARSALFPNLAVQAEMRLERANALGDGCKRVAGLLGTPLAALLIVLIGTSNLLWLDATSFFISALCISLFVQSTPVASCIEEEFNISFNVVTDGLRFILRNHLLFSLIAVSTITNLLDDALFSVGLPVYAKQIWRSVLPIGLLIGVFGGCAFISTLLFGVFGHSLPRRMTFALCFMALCVRFWGLALRLSLPLLVIVYAFNGLAVGPVNPIGLTVEQEIVPEEKRARVFGVAAAGSLAGVPVGVLLGSYLINAIGLLPAILFMGIGYLLTTSSLLVNPVLKEMKGVTNTRDSP